MRRFCSGTISSRSHSATSSPPLAALDGLPEERVFEMPSIFIGSVDRIVEEMQARRERYGISYYVLRDGHLEMVAPIIARLANV